MSGLLKPYGAKKLVQTLKQEIGIPIHLHTHNTTDNQIASYLLAAEAGVDIVDCAIGPLSSLTSQPSINSLVEALRGTERDTGIDPRPAEALRLLERHPRALLRLRQGPAHARHRHIQV